MNRPTRKSKKEASKEPVPMKPHPSFAEMDKLIERMQNIHNQLEIRDKEK